MKFLTSLFQFRKPVQKVDIARRFELVSRMGQGTMSKVWRARDGKTGRPVCLKVLDLEKTRKFEARFPKLNKPTEGEIAIKLKHPHVIQTLEFGLTTKNEQFLVMELIDGVSLSMLIDAQNEAMQRHRVRLMIELGEALSYVHKQGFIHRDICPRNVLLDRDYSLKLIDFGLTVPNTPPFQAPGNRTGTANYMAPELIKRQKTDQRLDIFAYAMTCYEMWAKRLPWDAAATLEAVMQHINAPPLELSVAVPTIEPGLAQAIMKGLAARPDDRWSSVDQMVAAIRACQPA